jgi:sarcosine oxidase
MERCDILIVGLGIMGAAATWRASLLGARVLAIEKGGPTHRKGSSHGSTRIFRKAYWEGERYLKLLSLSDRGWRELQRATNTQLIVQTGGLFIGSRSTGIVAGSLRTASYGKVEHERLTAANVRQRFPQFRVDDDMEAVYEPGAYAVLAEEARLQMLNEAVSLGAQLSYGEECVSISSQLGDPILTTRGGRRIMASSILVCAGAGNSLLLPELASVLQPRRVPIYWFEPRPGCADKFGSTVFPVFLYETKSGALLYGIAAGVSSESGVKIGFHNRQHVPYASCDERMPAIDRYAQEIERCVADIFPDLVPSPARDKWCIYTLTPDESFVIDQSSQHSGVFHASVCSGHGFKFAPAIGQVLAEQGIGLKPSIDLGAFALNRFDNHTPFRKGGSQS